MRWFGFILILLCAAAEAQEQERKLIDRVLKPNMALGNAAQNKTFGGAKSFSTGTNAYVKDFYFTEKFSAKSHATSPFRDSRNFWQGDFTFATSDANTKGRFEIPNASKAVDTKTMEVKDARESSKNYATRTYADTGDFRVRGKAQGALDAENAAKPPMTVEQVRELLNKNK
jgi:hypothetical protein